jgi:hypothetical protein
MLKEEKSGLPQGSSEAIKSVTIPGKKIDGSTVFYVVSVIGSFNKWSVSKRYSQFEELHNSILIEMNGKALPAGCELPPKKIKLFQSHTDAEFIEERRCLLEAYLKKLLTVEKLSKGEAFMKFLAADKDSNKE